MMAKTDKKFKVPKRHNILNLIDKMYKEEKENIKQNLATECRITTGLEIFFLALSCDAILFIVFI